jgi:hypothetical protein
LKRTVERFRQNGNVLEWDQEQEDGFILEQNHRFNQVSREFVITGEDRRRLAWEYITELEKASPPSRKRWIQKHNEKRINEMVAARAAAERAAEKAAEKAAVRAANQAAVRAKKSEKMAKKRAAPPSGQSPPPPPPPPPPPQSNPDPPQQPAPFKPRPIGGMKDQYIMQQAQEEMEKKGREAAEQLQEEWKKFQNAWTFEDDFVMQHENLIRDAGMVLPTGNVVYDALIKRWRMILEEWDNNPMAIFPPDDAYLPDTSDTQDAQQL